jgi:hypothetical protein
VGFSAELEATAFRSKNGEYAWREEDALRAVEELAAAGFPIFGGEVWLVRDGSINALPMTQDGPSVLAWDCEPRRDERPGDFVERAREESIEAITHLASIPLLDSGGDFEVRFNLTWGEPHVS